MRSYRYRVVVLCACVSNRKFSFFFYNFAVIVKKFFAKNCNPFLLSLHRLTLAFHDKFISAINQEKVSL
jgi:hypothetical protein